MPDTPFHFFLMFADAAERKRRASLTRWQRLKEDVPRVIVDLSVIALTASVMAFVFGTWVVGAWTILNLIMGHGCHD